MAYENIKKYILYTLGYPTVAVELTDEQLNICIEEAIDRWLEYGEVKIKYHKFQLDRGVDKYDIPPDALYQTPQGNTMRGVIYKPTNFEMFQYYFQYVLYNYRPINLSHIYLMFSNLESFQWITGQFITYKIIDGNKLVISPIPQESSPAILVYAVKPEEQLIETNLWIKKFALARAKQILGTIRSKLSIPTPGGDGSLDLRGSELYSQGQQEEANLYQELRDKFPVGGILVG